MAGSSKGTTGVGARAAGTKRTADASLGNGNAKRVFFSRTTEKPLVPVADLLNVDFWNFTKLCHRHDRQVGDLGNPFEALERWARRALPPACWDDSDRQVGHWMRSESLGAAYMFQNGYCYDNGREFVTVPTYGQWLEYDGFKHFMSDEGIAWYSILATHRLEFKMGNPKHSYLPVGSWTMSRFGKPVIVGKDNKFYQSVLDAFRERNPATITKDKEIEVPIKHLTMISDLEQEPEPPHSADMHEYGPVLRLVGGTARQIVSPQPLEFENMVVDQPEHVKPSEAKLAPVSPSKRATGMSSEESQTAESKKIDQPGKRNAKMPKGKSAAVSSSGEATGFSSEESQTAESKQAQTSSSPPAPSPFHTPEKRRPPPAKASHALPTSRPSGSVGPNKTIRGPLSGDAQQAPPKPSGKEKQTDKGSVTGVSSNRNTGLITPPKDQKTTPSPPASTSTASRPVATPFTAKRPVATPTTTTIPAKRPVATPTMATIPATPAVTRAAHAEREPEGKKHISGTGISATKGFNQIRTATLERQAASKSPTSTGTRAQQAGATGSFPREKAAQKKDDTTESSKHIVPPVAQDTESARAAVEAQLFEEFAAQRAKKTNAELAALDASKSQAGYTPAEEAEAARAAAARKAAEANRLRFELEAAKSRARARAHADKANTVKTTVEANTQPQGTQVTQELHGKSQGLSFGVEMEFMIPVILEEERDGTNIDDELLPLLNVIPLAPGEDVNGAQRKRYTDVLNSEMAVRGWVEDTLRDTLIELGVPVVDPEANMLSPGDANAQHVSADRAYWGWNVTNDSSVRIPQCLQKAYSGGKARWVSLELISPAYWATPKNLGEIRRVVGHLSTKLRVLTPESGGLHVHVGRGKSSFDLAELKRLAGLCYAAGPLLSQLHPASRHTNGYCQSNRLYSNLAHGMATEEAIARRSQPKPVCNRDNCPVPHKPHAKPMYLGEETEESRQRPADTPRFQRMIPRGDLPREKLSENLCDRGFFRDGALKKPGAIAPSINELWRAPTATDLVTLFQTNRYFAYNFARYVCDDDACDDDNTSDYIANLSERSSNPSSVAAGGGGGRSSSSSNNSSVSSTFAPNAFSDTSSSKGGHVCNKAAQTVEFRQAASTLDPDSVVAWVRVVVNLTCVALHTRIEEFSRLVHCCAKAEREPKWYDAFDLLVDLDMPRTAQFIQTSMLSRKTRSPWADLPAKGAFVKDERMVAEEDRDRGVFM
ncbi:hypothetical protein PG984_009543 [Apiospora sp. TS-2023a]